MQPEIITDYNYVYYTVSSQAWCQWRCWWRCWRQNKLMTLMTVIDMSKPTTLLKRFQRMVLRCCWQELDFDVVRDKNDLICHQIVTDIFGNGKWILFQDKDDLYEHEINSKNMEIMLIKLGFGLFISVGLVWCLYICCLRRGTFSIKHFQN